VGANEVGGFYIMNADRFCHCKGCKKAKRKGLILGSRLLRHFGDGAYHVSQYVIYHRYKKGRKPVVNDI
jgi:hypothetical protein